MIKVVALVLAFALMSASGVLGEEDFPILGTYTKDQACSGAAAQREDLRVRITRQQVSSSEGVCEILSRKREGKTFTMHVQCKIPGDVVVLGDVTFTMRDENTLDFDDQDHTSPAVLHRCNDK